MIGVYEQRWGQATGPLCVYLHGVGDPGNVGTVLRSAQAFGASCVALGPRCADPHSPKAVRASMGAIFSVSLARVATVAELPGERIALAADAEEPLAGPAGQGGAGVTLLVGAEREGLPEDVMEQCERRARIPIATESLNAAMAATVALYEMTRRGGWTSIRSRRHDRSDRRAAQRGRTGDRRRTEQRRAGGAAGPLPGAQGRTAADAARGGEPRAGPAGSRRQGRQPGPPGARGADLRARGGALGQRARGRAGGRCDRCDPSRRPPQKLGRLHVLTATRRELEDIFLGLGFTGHGGAGGGDGPLQLRRAQPQPDTPGQGTDDTFYVADPPGAEELVLRTHTSPMQVRAMEAHPPPLYVVIPGRVYRPRLGRHPYTPVPPNRGSGGRRGHHLGRPQGDAAAVRQGGLRRCARRAPEAAFLPLHRAQRRGRRLLLPLLRQGPPERRQPLLLCKGEGWLEVLGAGEVDPNVYAHVPTTGANSPGYDPEKVQGFAWGLGVERIAMLKHGIPDLRLYFENDLRFLEQFG